MKKININQRLYNAIGDVWCGNVYESIVTFCGKDKADELTEAIKAVWRHKHDLARRK